jgi:hypothetical protein
MAWEKRHVATHEAGHAVMACRCNIPFSSVTIVREGDADGLVATDWEPTKERAEDWALFLFAGHAACVAAGLPGGGNNSDFSKVSSALQDWDLNTFEEWKDRAITMMDQSDNKRAVALVVQLLLEHGTIASDIVEVCVRAEPSPIGGRGRY